MTQQQTTALAIMIGFALVAAAIFFGGGIQIAGFSIGGQPTAIAAEPMRTDDRRVFGDPKAAITIVEFSDVECPFCSRLHPTLEQVVLQSGGAVQWEYRHLPLPMHRNAELGAAATECVADMGGDELFWPYLQILLDNQGVHNEAFYVAEATALGVEEASFRDCLRSTEIAERIASDVAAARAYGGRGTPFSVVQFADGTTQAVSGALPFERWQTLLRL